MQQPIELNLVAGETYLTTLKVVDWYEVPVNVVNVEVSGNQVTLTTDTDVCWVDNATSLYFESASGKCKDICGVPSTTDGCLRQITFNLEDGHCNATESGTNIIVGCCGQEIQTSRSLGVLYKLIDTGCPETAFKGTVTAFTQEAAKMPSLVVSSACGGDTLTVPAINAYQLKAGMFVKFDGVEGEFLIKNKVRSRNQKFFDIVFDSPLPKLYNHNRMKAVNKGFPLIIKETENGCGDIDLYLSPEHSQRLLSCGEYHWDVVAKIGSSVTSQNIRTIATGSLIVEMGYTFF